MKARYYFLMGALSVATSLIAGAPADEELFVSPCLTELAGKAAFDAGSQLAGDKKQSYDHAFSLNVGKNLPSTTHVVGQKACHVVGLGAHVRQIADSLKNEGRGLIITPASYGTLFTDGSVTDCDANKHIDAVLAKIGKAHEQELIVQSLGELKEVVRATFVQREGKLQLVTDDKTIALGEKVWRKTPEGVKEEIFHSEEEYLVAIRNAGLSCEEIKRPCFFGEVKWKAFNSSRKENEAKLGGAYVDHNPFTVFVVTKKA